MRVLLVGDYSGVHSELADALTFLGHEVTVVSGGDGYKNFKRDLDIPDPILNQPFIFKLILIIADLLGLKGFFSYFRYREKINNLKGYDVVQLMNPIALPAFGSLVNIFFVNKLYKQNKKIFLCALGDDHFWVDKCINNYYKYSALDRLKFRTITKYIYSLRYKYGLFFKANHYFVINKVTKVIPGLADYQIAYENDTKLADMIRIPISSKLINEANVLAERYKNESIPLGKKLKIFHGWQKGKDLRKGNDILDKAAKIILEKYGGEYIDYQVVSNVSYSEYINLFDECDIFFDQVYSYDRGVNALLGMAKGKVVFSGFEMEVDDKSNFSKIGINATPDVNSLVESIEKLIKNPNLIKEIRINSLDYILKNHEPLTVAKEYMKVWEKG